MPENPIDEFYVQALMLAEVVKRILTRKAKIVLDGRPTIVLKPIVDFKKRMRVSSFEKFKDRTYIATVNFYADQESLEKHDAIGVIVLYIGESYMPKLFKALNYPSFDEDDENSMEDACGTLCNLIAGNFKTGLSQLGYDEVVMSHFSTFRNEVISGVEYSFGQKNIYEISFEIDGQKKIYLDLSMGNLRKIIDD